MILATADGAQGLAQVIERMQEAADRAPVSLTCLACNEIPVLILSPLGGSSRRSSCRPTPVFYRSQTL